MRVPSLLKGLRRGLRAAEDVEVVGWYRSETFWVNACIAGAALLHGVGWLELPITDTEAATIALGILGAVNVALRNTATKPIGLRTKRKGNETIS